MSRYTLPAFDAAYTVIVGWDAPLQTFFSQVIDANEEVVCWAGASRREQLTTIRALRKSLEGWAVVSAPLARQLLVDQRCSTKPSLLQQRMIAFLEQGIV